MAVGINEYILRLQVTVRDTFFVVQKFKDETDFGRVEASGGFLERLLAP